jgi:hypothetical protein
MLLSSFLLFMTSSAFAWDDHQEIMLRLMDSSRADQRTYLRQKIKMPCPDAERKELLILGLSLHVDASRIPLFSEGHCKSGVSTSSIKIADMVASSIIDEPDQGMDQNLPESDDLANDRKWMGGSNGPTSQGFRHMFFKGVEWRSPIKTFQIPFGPVGQALERVKKMREVSDAYFARGDLFWGTRILLWELHYVQDLQQPFHVLQVPAFSLLPLKKIFSSFVKASTHAIGNYHYAYEGIALELVKGADTSSFSDCFEIKGKGKGFSDPAELIFYSRSVGNELGHELHDLLGDSPKLANIDLPNDVGGFDYYELIHLREPEALTSDELNNLSSDDKTNASIQKIQWEALGKMKALTCGLMNKVSELTWSELDRASVKLQSVSTSNKSAK